MEHNVKYLISIWQASPRFAKPAGVKALFVVMMGVIVSMAALSRADDGAQGRYYPILAHTQVGLTLLGQHPQATSSRNVLKVTVGELSGHFEGGIKLTGNFKDKDDHATIASFTARFKGVAVKGVIFASIGSKGGTAALLFDAVDAPASNFSQLAAALPNSEVKWNDAQIPDGTGSMRLPSDWKITGCGGNGSVATAGPEGQTVVLSMMLTYITPQAAADYRQMQLNAGNPQPLPPNFPVLPYTDPVKACENVLAMLNREAAACGEPKVETQILESAPIEETNGQSAIVHVLSTIDDGKTVTRRHSFGLSTVMPLPNGHWMYYTSYVAAPEGIYQRDLDSMLEIWSSWKVNAAVTYERMRKAAKSMNAISEMIVKSHESSGMVVDHACADFDETIRGFRRVEDTFIDDHGDANLGNVDKVVEELNKQAGYQRYIEVPLRDQ